MMTWIRDFLVPAMRTTGRSTSARVVSAGLLAVLLILGGGALAGAAEPAHAPPATPQDETRIVEPRSHEPAHAGQATTPATELPGTSQHPAGQDSRPSHPETGRSSTHETGGAGHEAGGHGAGGHGAGGHGETSLMDEAIHTAENVSFIDLILQSMGYRKPHAEEPDTNPPLLKTLALFQLPMISILVILILAMAAGAAASKREMIPGPFQNFVEVIVGGISDFVEGILGLQGRRFVPYVGSLFLYIWISNLIGIIPFFKAPTSSINTTVALAICTFLYVQYIALRGQGLGGYLFHLAGEPRDGVGWAMVPLMLPLHIIGEFAKPMSLCLRLFGNIFGEETLVAVFVGMGVAALAFTQLPIGLPFQTPFYFLALLTSTIQALVFSLLTTIYISLVLPHHHDGHGHETARAGGHGAAAHHGAH